MLQARECGFNTDTVRMVQEEDESKGKSDWQHQGYAGNAPLEASRNLFCKPHVPHAPL